MAMDRSGLDLVDTQRRMEGKDIAIVEGGREPRCLWGLLPQRRKQRRGGKKAKSKKGPRRPGEASAYDEIMTHQGSSCGSQESER
jgi:hypothetical protein